MAKSTLAHCPHCGQKIVLSTAARTPAPPARRFRSFGGGRHLQTFEHSQRSQQFENAFTSSAAPAGVEAQRVTPIGRLEPKDVTTAIYDAGISFALVSIAAGGVCWYFDLTWWFVPVAGGAAAFWRYFGGLSLAKTLLEKVETVTQLDLNLDGDIGDQEAPPQTVRLEVKNTGDGPSRYEFADLQIEPVKLRELAFAILSGDSFAERTGTGAGLTQAEFCHLRDEFIRRNWAEWNHPTRKQQGVTLRRPGRFVLQAIADTPLPTPLSGGYPPNSTTGSTQQHAAQEPARLDAGNYEHIGGAE